MSAFVLKIIACLTMFIDHLGYVVFDGHGSYLNYIGRLAFPIFAFQISEGYIHTKNLKQYFVRLLVFALVSQIPFMLFHSIITENFSLNVIFTLLIGLLAITIYDKLPKVQSIPVIIILGIIAQITKCDYGFYGVAIILLFYACRDHKILSTLSFLLATAIYFLGEIIAYSSFGLYFVASYYTPYAICTMLAIFPILLYNKKKGLNTKYLIYLFYPLHLIALYIATIL